MLFQIRGLANEVACLQSQLEQSETERQSLHLQLTLAERDSRQSSILLSEKEAQWNSMQTAMQGRFMTVRQEYVVSANNQEGREREGGVGRERERVEEAFYFRTTMTTAINIDISIGCIVRFPKSTYHLISHLWISVN